MPRRVLLPALVALHVAAFPASSRAVEATGVRASMGGARSLALGGALVAVPGVDAAAQNPAALAGSAYGALQLDHRALASGLARQSGVLALRPWADRDAVVAVRADIVRQSGIAAPEALSGAPRAVPSRAAWRASVSGASSIGHGVVAGATFGRMRGVPAWEDTDAGFVADLGLAWQHAGTRVALATSGISMTSSAGAPDYSFGVSQDLLQGRVLCTAQVDRTHAEATEPAGGVEVWAHRAVALRAGGRGGDEPVGAGGLGVRWDRVHLDYACSAQKHVGPVHALSLQFDLGSPAPVTKPVARPKPVAAEKPRAAVEKPAVAPATPPTMAVEKPPVAPATQAPLTVEKPPVAPTSPAPVAVEKPVATTPRPPVQNTTQAAPVAPVPASGPKAPAAGSASPSFPPLLAPLPSATKAPAASAPPASPPAPVQAPAPTPAAPAPVEDTAPALYRVFTGPYSKLEDLAPDVGRLRMAGFFPEIERQGDGFLLVVRRGVSRSVAEDCVSRVRQQQLRVHFVRE